MPPAVSAPPIRIVVPLPLALKSANAWLFPGARPALVDCGVGTAEGHATLLAGLRAAKVDPARLRLFVTHGHIDHAGNAAALRRDHGVELSAPPAEAPFVETFRRDAARRSDAFARALARHGAPPEAVAASRERAGHMDAWMEDVPIAKPLRDGERLVLGDVDVTAHVTPGHTPGSTVFLTAGNHLLSGDTLLEHITSNAIELVDRDKGRYAQYLRTLEGLRRFVGAHVLPGHHDPFPLTDTLLDSHLEKHHRRTAKVLAALDAPRTAWELLPRVLPHLAHDQVFLGMCEMVGHLHLLEIDAKVRVVEVDGVRRFSRA
ncbi:MAG TPA: MBL fold metallo-hydrolase [Candidatus Thermoplasmatota archaeon]|nr:MBL fold metallo-hydrolase [Candidatus Thermoplasmatota archaeon]